MNLSVHSIMYFYYFMGAVGLRKVVRPFAPLITTIQILQMVGGIAVTVTAALHYDR
jgi:elongation of very long chain fatty acids protein 6